jgi:enoyl-CoA hydratase/carnithine racemase
LNELTDEDPVLYEVKDKIATITLNRPHRLNAMNVAMVDRLPEIFRQFDRDDDAHIAIVRGNGKAFCAGGDLKEMSESGAQHIFEQTKNLAAVRYPSATYQFESSKPIIGAIHGYALAGGFTLSLACDIRIAAEDATFGVSEVKVGRGAPWAVPLLWAVPSGIAMELLLRGNQITAQRAYEVGYVNQVVPNDQLFETAWAVAEEIRDNAPITVRAHKRLLYRAMDAGRALGYLLADEMAAEIYTSDDCQEGQRAFREGRKPNFTGR